MTALDAGADTRPAAVRHRTLNVVRLQFVNSQTFVWVPALVLGRPVRAARLNCSGPARCAPVVSRRPGGGSSRSVVAATAGCVVVGRAAAWVLRAASCCLTAV